MGRRGRLLMSNRLVLGPCDNHPDRGAVLQTAAYKHCLHCAMDQHGAAPFTLWRSKHDRDLCYEKWQTKELD